MEFNITKYGKICLATTLMNADSSKVLEMVFRNDLKDNQLNLAELETSEIEEYLNAISKDSYEIKEDIITIDDSVLKELGSRYLELAKQQDDVEILLEMSLRILQDDEPITTYDIVTNDLLLGAISGMFNVNKIKMMRPDIEELTDKGLKNLIMKSFIRKHKETDLIKELITGEGYDFLEFNENDLLVFKDTPMGKQFIDNKIKENTNLYNRIIKQRKDTQIIKSIAKASFNLQN